MNFLLETSFIVAYRLQLFFIFGIFEILGERFILINVFPVVFDAFVQHILH